MAKEGCFPECESCNIEYIGVDKPVEGEVTLNFQCVDCGFLGKENYSTNYKGTNKMENTEEIVDDELDDDLEGFGDEEDFDLGDDDIDDALADLED